MPAGFVDRVSCGEAIVTQIATVRRWWFRPPFAVSDDEIRKAAPQADEEARLPLDFTTLHIAFGRLSVVVDPGRLTAAQRLRYRDAELTPGVAEALAELGIDRRDVTHVVVSHAHADHFSGITDDDEGMVVAYPRARHVMSRVDWENPGHDVDLFRRQTRLISGNGLVDLIDADREIEPGLSLLATPGETPGHLCVRLRSQGRSLYWIGDLVHHSMEVDHPDWAMAGADAGALELSRRRIFGEAAGSDAVVVWAHAPFPGWGHVARDGSGFIWRRLDGEAVPIA